MDRREQVRRAHIARRSAASPDAPVEASAGAGEGLDRLAHELNGLLDGSLRFLVLARRSEDAGDVKRQLARAEAGMSRMASLLARAMRPGGLAGLGWAASDEPLIDAILLAVEMARPAAFMKGVEVHADCSPRLVLAPAGPAYTVLSNALRNAVEAMSGEGRIDVHAEMVIDDRGRHAVELTVVDNGPGPIEGWRSRAFSYGYTTKPGGLGVGLAMIREIAAELDGEVSLERNGPETPGWRANRPGATFTFRYPLTV